MSLQVRIKLVKAGFTLDADFTTPEAGISVLFGPSGSGKSTLLRCLAGLEPVAEGKIILNGSCWHGSQRRQSMPTHQRGVGMVFQEPGLFSHLNVIQNLRYAAKRSGASDSEVDTTVSLLKLEALLERDTTSLSGGEQRRVAIARALLGKPELLLLDEPMAALDLQRKNEILPYLDQLRQQLNINIIYVTHNMDELLTLADYLLLMDGGRIIAHGQPTRLLTRLDLPIARRSDACSIVECEVLEHDTAYRLTRMQLGDQELNIPLIDAAIGRTVKLRIQARDVSLCPQKPLLSSILNILPATVSEVSEPDQSGQLLVKLHVANAILLARISMLSGKRLQLAAGVNLFAQIKGVALTK